MAKIRLRAGLRYDLNDKVYEIQKVHLDGMVEVYDMAFGRTNTVTEESIREALFQGKLQFEVAGRNTKTKAKKKMPTEYTWADFTKVPEAYRSKAWLQYCVIKEVLKIPEEERSEEQIRGAAENGVARLKEEQGREEAVPSLRSIYRWLNYNKAANGDIRAFIPLYYRCGCSEGLLNDEVNKIIQDAAHYINKKLVRPDHKDIYEEVLIRVAEFNNTAPEAEKLDPPTYRTVCRRLGKKSYYEMLVDKYGKEYADKECRSTGDGIEVERILERVEFDHTPLNMVIVDDQDGRPIGKATLTVCIDVYSGYPLGYYLGFEPASDYTIMECLYHAISPKNYVKSLYPDIEGEWLAYGIPEELAVDRGKDFQGNNLDAACAQLGISILDCPVASPNFKPKIERFFGSIAKRLIHKLPGTSFSGIFEKKDYDSERHAVLTLSDIHHIIHIWIIDKYAKSFHRGIKAVPAKKWTEGLKYAPIAYPPSAKELRILLSSTEERTIQHYGLELFGIQYNSPQLALLRINLPKGERVELKYRKDDLSKVYVYDPLLKDYIEVPATNQEYTRNLSLYKHKVTLEFIRQEGNKIDHSSLARASKKIQVIVEDAFKAARRNRRNAARLLKKETSIVDIIDDDTEEPDLPDGYSKDELEDNVDDEASGSSNVGYTHKDPFMYDSKGHSVELPQEENQAKSKNKPQNTSSRNKKTSVPSKTAPSTASAAADFSSPPNLDGFVINNDLQSKGAMAG